MKRRDFLATSLGLPIAGLGLPLAVSAGSSEEPFRPGHRILDLELLDAHRQRPVPARLYMPYRASPDAPVPMVVFSHGLGGSRMGYSYLARHWADVGVASLHPQHVGSDNHVWRGNPLGLVQRLQLAASDDEALARVLDLRFTLDQILGSEQVQLIDVTKIAVAGHSYGANTAMLVAGAKVNTDNANLGELRDQRIQAAILISAPPLLGQGPANQVLGEVRIPTLHITSLKDTINLPGYRSTVEDRIAIFDAMSASPRTLVVFNTGGHSIFTDRTTSSGPETSERIKGATGEISTIFLRHALKPERPTVNSQSTVDHWEVDKKSTLLPMDLLAQQSMKQWFNQHMDLVDRFETPGNTLP